MHMPRWDGNNKRQNQKFFNKKKSAEPLIFLPFFNTCSAFSDIFPGGEILRTPAFFAEMSQNIDNSTRMFYTILILFLVSRTDDSHEKTDPIISSYGPIAPRHSDAVLLRM